MKPIRSMAAGVAAAAISITTLAGALGSVSATAATVKPDAAKVTWHKLALVGGWQSGISIDDAGYPAWAVKDGVVYLDGEITQPSGGSIEFATLPKPARPSRIMYIVVHVPSGAFAWLTIYRDGEMTDESGQPADAQSATTLSSVSFPAASTATRKLSLIHGWQSGRGYGTGDPSYTVRHGIVYLAGSLQGQHSTGATFARLPRGARPAHVLWVAVYTYGGTIGALEIEPNGNMIALLGDATSFTSLAAVSFPVAAIRAHKLTLIDEWQSVQPSLNTGDPSYIVKGGVVYLSGSLKQPTPFSAKFAVLPAAARPTHTLNLKIFTENAVVGILEIYPNGQMWALSFPSSNAQEYTSLAAVSYPVNS